MDFDLFKKNKKTEQKSAKDVKATEEILNETEEALQGDPLKEAVEKKQDDQRNR